MGMIQDYQAGATVRELAKKYGVAYSTIAHDLRLAGIERRPRGPRPTKAKDRA
jgi:transposase